VSKTSASPSGPFVITGLSGSGKTVLSRSLEDVGYRCVDNIPLGMVIELFERCEHEVDRLAVVLDLRAEGFAAVFPEILKELSRRWPGLRLVFVEADFEALMQRFSVARRPHPLRGKALQHAIQEESESLQAVRRLADVVVDTTRMNPHELRRQAMSLAGVPEPGQLLSLEVESFSYLQAVPPTASLVFDVRFLPNPYFVDELRSLPGDDPTVIEWMTGFDEVSDAIRRIVDLVLYLVPRYGDEMKTNLTVAVGCTGGRHRSVYVASKISEAMAQSGYEVTLHHRDKDRWRYK